MKKHIFYVYMCLTVLQEYLLSRNIYDSRTEIKVKTITQQINKRKENKISKTVDRVLKQVLGKEATHLIYKYLESNHSLERSEIPEKIDVFAKGIEEFLSSGACAIERKILEDIYSSYGLLRRIELERTHEYDFVGQIRSLTHKT